VGNYSFAAYLLGANPINSLPAHHFCPRCRRMAFSDGQDGWDLPVRRCECGVMMERDGHSLSIDICRHSQLNLSISCGNPAFRRRALEIMAECFPECVLPGSADIEKPFAVVCFAPAKSALPEGNLRRYFGLLPHVRFHPDDIGREIAELEHLTGTCFDRVDFLEDTVLERFFINHVENFPLYGAIFGGEFLRELIERFRPASCGEYMKLFALHYDSSVWRKAGMERLEEMLLHREDLYDLLAAGMRRKGYADNGFALTVTNNAGCGYYRQHGLDRETARFLAELELPDWVGKSLPHIGYLHSRADTLRELRICFILLWYQLHYPAEFAQVMKPDR